MFLNDTVLTTMIDVLVPDCNDGPAPSIQPASIDLHVGDEFVRMWGNQVIHIDAPDKIKSDTVYGTLTLPPGGFALATTSQTIHVPDDMLAKVEGCSTLGRMGLAVHITAGFIDPGFTGKITLELKNVSPNTLVIKPGDRICQLAYALLVGEASSPYRGRYQNQDTVTAPRPRK